MNKVRASLPPSEPQSRASRPDAFSEHEPPGNAGNAKNAAVVQMLFAMFVGFLLFSIPLYLWRRPRVVAGGTATDGPELAAGSLGSPRAAGGEWAVAAPPAALTLTGTAAASPPVLSAPTIVECNDKGTRKNDCDHPAELEKAFADAIQASAGCLPADTGGGTIEYVLDVIFAKKKVNLIAPKEGRTVRATKAVTACTNSVRHSLGPLDVAWKAPHDHTRYKIAVTATYANAKAAPAALRP